MSRANNAPLWVGAVACVGVMALGGLVTQDDSDPPAPAPAPEPTLAQPKIFWPVAREHVEGRLIAEATELAEQALEYWKHYRHPGTQPRGELSSRSDSIRPPGFFQGLLDLSGRDQREGEAWAPFFLEVPEGGLARLSARVVLQAELRRVETICLSADLERGEQSLLMATECWTASGRTPKDFFMQAVYKAEPGDRLYLSVNGPDGVPFRVFGYQVRLHSIEDGSAPVRANGSKPAE